MVSQSVPEYLSPWRPEHFIGGHPALDFVNTISDRADPTVAVDRFDNLENIADWCEQSGVLSETAARLLGGRAGGQDQQATLIAGLRKLRGQAGEIFDAIAGSGVIPAADFAHVLTTAGATVAALELERGHNPIQIRDDDQPIVPDQLAGILALRVLDAIYRLPHARIRACPACRWLFCDGSRGGRRKWCSMRECGNREKVRRHYRRHAE